MLILPDGALAGARIAESRREMELLAGRWVPIVTDDCLEEPQPCMDCYQPLSRSERQAVAPALICHYGQNRDILKAQKFRCKDGCKPRA